MIRRPPRSTRVRSSAASDVYKRQELGQVREPLRLALGWAGARLVRVLAVLRRHDARHLLAAPQHNDLLAGLRAVEVFPKVVPEFLRTDLFHGVHLHYVRFSVRRKRAHDRFETISTHPSWRAPRIPHACCPPLPIAMLR